MNVSFPWEKDPQYYELDKRIRGNVTLVTIDRCYVIYRAAAYAHSLPGEGCAAEVGVYKGGTSFLIGQHFKDRKVYMFDSFAGLPAVTTGVDLHHVGDFNDVNFEAVKALCSEPCFEVRKGFFPDTATGLDDVKFAFVHLDADLYQSTADGLKFFWPKMVPGGIFILDDFYWGHCPGVAKATDEFCAATGACAIPLPNCTAMIIKQPSPA